MNNGVHLSLKADKETITVHLGPSWFIDKQDIKIQEKDKIQVKGSRIDLQGKSVIIAMDFIKDGKAMILRDDSGKPLWSGGNK